MNVILLTILLTVLGICLVAFFTWLGISSYKLMKFKKKGEAAFKHLERWIMDNHTEINKKVEDDLSEIRRVMSEDRNFLENFIQKVSEDVNNSISHNVDDLYKTSDDHYNTLTSKIDSRCDKLQDKLDNLKKDEETHYELLKQTQRMVDNILHPNIFDRSKVAESSTPRYPEI